MKFKLLGVFLLGLSLNASGLANDAKSIGQDVLNSANCKKDRISKIECEVNILKEAVAKLIENKNYKEAQSTISNLDKIVTSIAGDVGANTASENKIKCVVKKVPKTYANANIKDSFFKFDSDKTFKVNTKLLTVYKNPELNSDKTGVVLKRGEFLQADLYTKAGWVQMKNGGWVKGYLLHPKFEAEKVNVVYETKEICE